MTNGTVLPARDWRVDYEIALEVASHEAVVRQAYKDSQGVWTWSVGLTNATGHDVMRYIGKPQPLAHCLAIYVWALDRYADAVRKAFGTTPLTKAQFASALSFHWNTGAISRASWVKDFKAGNIAKARANFMSFRKPPEIIGRRTKERDLFFDGKWSNNGTMTEYTKLSGQSTPVWSSAKRLNVENELRAAFAGARVAPPVDQPRAIGVPNPGQIVRADIDPAAVQASLRELGYFEVGIVGDPPGGKTAGAITAFRLDRGIGGEAVIDEELVTELGRAKVEGWRRPIASARAEASSATVAQKLPEAKAARQGKLMTMWGAITGAAWSAVNFVKDNIYEARSYVEPLTNFVDDIPSWVWWIGTAAVLYALYRMNAKTEREVGAAYRSGARA